MGITSKSYTDSLINSIDASARTYQTSVSAKSTSELFKSYNSNSAYRNDNFKSVLNSTSVSKEKDTEKVDSLNNNQVKDTDTSKDAGDVNGADELNEKLKKLEDDSKEDDSKSDSKDNVNDILEELLNLLAKYGIKEEDLKANGKINQELLKSLLDKISKQGSSNNSNSIMEKIIMLLKNDSVKDNLNTDSLKTISNILNNLSSKLSGEDSENAKNIKNLASQIANMLDDKHNQDNKVLTLEDMLRSKNYSQDSSGSSTGDDGAASKDNKELSKEDKFLNSLIDDKKDDSLNKINLFASRVATTQNQSVNTVRGLTINKATMVDDLIKDVKYMSANSLKELTVKVNPGNLGEITIKLVQQDGLIKADLKANSKETAALLSQNLADIKKQLSDQSIKISDVNIELYQDDTTFFKEQGFEGQFSGGQNNQNNSPQSRVSTTQSMADEDLSENLAEENNNVNAFA